MTNIYEQHEKSFNNVRALVAFKLVNGEIREQIKIAFKFPKDGAGRLTCYLHLIGVPMVRGFATGYGCDKKSAAIWDAAKRINMRDGDGEYMPEIESLQTALRNADSKGFDSALREAGYTLMYAV